MIWIGYLLRLHLIIITLHQIYNEDKEFFQIAKQIDDTLFTHAGVSKDWLKDAIQKPLQHANLSDFDMAGILNDESIVCQRKKAEDRKLKNVTKAIVRKSLIYKSIKKIKQKNL